MDGRNSSGRTVSLLIDSPSHPSPQPQTPPLVRSASSDSSSDSRTFASPSPLTPHSTSFFPSHAQKHPPQSLHHAHGPHAPQQAYYLYRQPSWSSQKMDDQALYPGLLPDSTITGFPLPNQPMPQARMRNSTSPISESHRSIASATSVHQQKTAKKNQYPCPLARQYQCNDHFTTSGHAARHAKKHTGRKDAICPECNKAFTRKDNMEQHRRTHQNVRGPAKGSSSENRVKKPSKASRKGDKADKSGSVAASVATPTFEAAVHAQLEEQQQVQQMPLPDAAHFVLPTDPQLQQTLIAGGPGPYFMSADPIAALPQPMQIPADFVGGVARPQLYRSGYTNTLDFSTIPLPPTLGDGDLQFSYPSPGLSNGLNTLALAASGHRRLSEPNERRPQAERIDSEASSTKSSAATP